MAPVDDTPHPDSEPIDVNELLESTRKLFEPEELQRAMEQAGYTPDLPTSNSEDPAAKSEPPAEPGEQETADLVDDHPETGAVNQGGELESVAGTEDTPPQPPATAENSGEELVDKPAQDESVQEEPARQGVNLLSIIAFVLALALSPLAVIFGYIALGQTRRARQRGEIFALWAIGLGWLVFAAWVVLIASLVWIGYQQGITVDSLRDFIELFSLP